jgi:cell division protein FtsW (lipid II flippase)
MKKFQDILWRLLTTRVAWPIVISIGLLCMASILSLQLTSPERATRQQIHIAIGFVVMMAMLIPHFQDVGRLAYGLLIVSVVLLMLVFTSTPINGSRRWFQVGESVQLQPSELAKIAYVLSMAWYLRYRKDIQTLSGLVVPFLMTLVPFGLILLEPDLGTALLFPFALYVILIAAGARLRHLVSIALIVLLAAPGAYPFLKDYQKERIKTVLKHWITPEEESRSVTAARRTRNTHQLMSVAAISSGGVAGLGTDGALYAEKVPERHTDFVFAVVGARWGLLGCVTLLLMYLGFFLASLEIAGSTKDPFGRLMVVGLASIILLQAMINVSMTTALAPVVGITLPFVSYGGSSLLTNMIAAGLLLNVSIRRQGNALN